MFKKKTQSAESAERITETPLQVSIRMGDSARDAGDWKGAAVHYTEAVKQDASLAHIWVQLGHALKEQDDLSFALRAYQEAIALDPEDTETLVHAAHAAKNLGKFEIAIEHFLAACHVGLDAPREEEELLDLLSRQARHGGSSALSELIHQFPERELEAPLLSRLREISRRQLSLQRHDLDADQARYDTVVFDISDLVSYWRNARLPTGIQRVQIETIIAALDTGNSEAVMLCCFTQGRDEWLSVPTSMFTQLCELAVAGGEEDEVKWEALLSDLQLGLTLSPPFTFPRGATLVNLGTSWWLQNYFLYVRHAKATRGIKYIPFVHDMIPIMASEHCTRELTQDFISWALGVFDHADYFLVNSEYTAKDLRGVASLLGHEVKDESIAVIPLDSDFRKDASTLAQLNRLEDWQLEPGKFVLFVSTIESRKGHLFAFEAWSKLIDKLGVSNVPKLVCVGNRGWLNDEIYDQLDSDMALKDNVLMLSGLSDAELGLLYKNCRFTLYPSVYEGWGLPVTESLCYGRVPLASDAASLPEAGGEFAVYAESGNAEDLFAKAERLVTDDEYLTQLEERIADEYSPRTWSELANQIVSQLSSFQAQQDRTAHKSEDELSAPEAYIGHWHSLTRNTSRHVWTGMRSAETYRSGLGWYWPEERGCRVKDAQGQLSFRLNEPHEGLSLMIKLRGDENALCHYSIVVDDRVIDGELPSGKEKWVQLEISPSEAGSSYVVEFNAHRNRNGTRPTYFVEGFLLYFPADPVMRLDFIEAVTIGNLDRIGAFREGGRK
ncbi:glycosyltransferase family 4 protein [Altererythrobacter lutimaris]|uniref:Glycosyltransferase n=1 Tax=Altererythrobacter lutimaris TaxID=2743979 RepID=A0A850HD21_9SPHN|nr:glycosyltransferase [Altererythrobacter lutimaris]NVE94578.1 glycosyltransferase [Altererythrobacter lutimaris]